jgi:hypothetical protein
VTYLDLTFTDGQQLKLIPVTFAGHRYVAWAALSAMTIRAVTAHLGGPNADSGQTETAIPFDLPGQLPSISRWYKPGQAVPRSASAVIGSATSAGRSWSITAYVGAWGTCVLLDSELAGCLGIPSGGASVLGPITVSAALSTFVVGAPDVASLRLTLSDGVTLTVHTVRVGDERLAAATVPTGVSITRWTAYDAAGHERGSGTWAVRKPA